MPMLNPVEGEIFCFKKPYTMTSFRVVSKVRGILCNRLGIKNLKVGHAGTLDPLATGVLIICTGKATKQIDTLQAGTKEYIATLKLGATTPSFDMETEEDQTYPYQHISREMVEEVLQHFVGEIKQVPPNFSAVKIDGKRAYKMARKGNDVKPQAIKIKQVDQEEAMRMADMAGQPTITIRIVCSKGTYIRALARDIGEALQSGAYLTSLIRTRIGDYRIQEARDIETFEQWVDTQQLYKPEE